MAAADAWEMGTIWRTDLDASAASEAGAMAPAPQKQPVAAPVPQLRKASQPQVPAAVAQFQAAATSDVAVPG